jgi:two-component system OmpR family response regulator
VKFIRVLLVDDEPEFTNTLSKVLSLRDMQVDVCSSAECALEAVSRQAFDVVLLDVKMPGISGLACLAELRRISPALPVILLTGHLAPEEEQRGLGDGAVAYLLKPFPVPDLVALIRRTVK